MVAGPEGPVMGYGVVAWWRRVLGWRARGWRWWPPGVPWRVVASGCPVGAGGLRVSRGGCKSTGECPKRGHLSPREARTTKGRARSEARPVAWQPAWDRRHSRLGPAADTRDSASFGGRRRGAAPARPTKGANRPAGGPNSVTRPSGRSEQRAGGPDARPGRSLGVPQGTTGTRGRRQPGPGAGANREHGAWERG